MKKKIETTDYGVFSGAQVPGFPIEHRGKYYTRQIRAERAYQNEKKVLRGMRVIYCELVKRYRYTDGTQHVIKLQGYGKD